MELDWEGPLYVINKKIPQMVKRNLTRATCHCKTCGGKDTVLIRRAPKPGRRGEIVRWACRADGCSNMGMT